MNMDKSKLEPASNVIFCTKLHYYFTNNDRTGDITTVKNFNNDGDGRLNTTGRSVLIQRRGANLLQHQFSV